MLPPPAPSRFLALALVFMVAWGAGTAPSHAAFIAEGSFDSATRSSINYNAPYPPGPTYTLAHGGRLQAGVERRYSGYYYDTGLKFALGPAIALGQPISLATLTLNVAEFQSYSGDRSVSVGLTAFGTTSAALALADFAGPQVAAGSATVVGNFDPYGYSGSDEGRPLPLVTFDVTAVVNNLLAAGATSVGFILTQGSNNGLFFSPASDPNPTYQPTLNISAVPAPPAAVLMLLGALGVGPLARIRRRGR